MENTIKLTDKSKEVFGYVKANGGRVSIDELVQFTGRTARSVNANVTDLCNEKKGLCVREKVDVDGEEKPITYVCLTDAGKAFEVE
jgi:hypothetical protein